MCAPSEDSDQPGLCTQWITKDPMFLHVDSEDSDQTGQMPRLIRVLVGRTLILLVLSCRGSNLILSMYFINPSKVQQTCVAYYRLSTDAFWGGH